MVLLTDLVSTSWREFFLAKSRRCERGVYLIDAAHSETKGTSLDSGSIHVVANHENELRIAF